MSKLREYRIRDGRVLAAMEKVPRHLFLPAPYRHVSNPYGDHPCPIGHRQTISQPFIVAYMTQCLDLMAGDRVLGVGTGSGYQAAVLSEMNVELYSVEVVSKLAEHARRVLDAQGYQKVHIKVGDGYEGWPEHAPYDGILVTCAPRDVPQTLVDQLADGGRMVLPVGEHVQRLVILRRKGDKIIRKDDLMVRFVPMVRG
jgi:protein-L-isoaspartate(D-aspartate) O-methyltransferase